MLVEAVSGPVDTDPDVLRSPLQSPLAMQVVASVLDHLRVAAFSKPTWSRLVLKVKVGAATTVKVTVSLTDTPLPVQVSV